MNLYEFTPKPFIRLKEKPGDKTIVSALDKLKINDYLSLFYSYHYVESDSTNNRYFYNN